MNTGFICASVLALVVAEAAASVSRIMLSPTGPEISRIAYGTLHMAEASSPQEALMILNRAVAQGITTFDLADVYGGDETCLKMFGVFASAKCEAG